MKKFRAQVIRGSGHGRTIGHSTANLKINDDMRRYFRKSGVWAVKVKIGGKDYKGALFWGRRSLFAERKPVCEVLLLDYAGDDLYGKEIEVEIVLFLRESVVVEDDRHLKTLIKNDLKRVRELIV